jgi:hypothetical protein
MMAWDDNERSPYIAHKHSITYAPDMAEVLKEIVLMSRHQQESSIQDDEEDIDYVLPDMYYEYPDIELPEYVDESDDEIIEALETDALDAYFEHCYEGLCKNKYAYA